MSSKVAKCNRTASWKLLSVGLGESCEVVKSR